MWGRVSLLHLSLLERSPSKITPQHLRSSLPCCTASFRQFSSARHIFYICGLGPVKLHMSFCSAKRVQCPSSSDGSAENVSAGIGDASGTWQYVGHVVHVQGAWHRFKRIREMRY
ncbi:hypothetical protein F5141DRAFT_1110687 [Pisolithus sp. B1]|nr:hypothetical protein F5141DRAFT_1110687 [Pisolithus sp. B1]